MKGKILNKCVISGDDGNRYNFNVADVKNLGGENIANLFQAQVDFVADGEVAKEIYITSRHLNFRPADFMKDVSVSGIKMKAYIAIISRFLVAIPFIGLIFSIIGLALQVMIILALQRASGSKTLFKNIIIAICCAVAAGLTTAFVIFGSIGLSAVASGRADAVLSSIGFFGVVGAIFALAFIFGGLYFSFKYYRELAYITQQKLFLYTFYTYIAGGLTSFIGIGFVIVIIALILEICAWYKFSEIKAVDK